MWINWVQWAPWHRYKDAGDMDGDIPEGVEAPEVKEEGGRPKLVVESRDPVPRDFYISKWMAISTDIPEAAMDVIVGSKGWGGNPIIPNVGPDLQRY